MMAGGAVTSATRTTSRSAAVLGRSPALAIIGLFVWLGFTNRWMLVFAVGVLIGVPPRARSLRHRSVAGMKATQFFIGFGPACGASTGARPSTACACCRSAPSCGSSG